MPSRESSRHEHQRIPFVIESWPSQLILRHAQRTSQWFDLHVERNPETLIDFVDSLQERGQYTFSCEEALAALGSTPVALKRAADRLKASGTWPLRVWLFTPSCRWNTGNRDRRLRPPSSTN